jgi:hypothetical protein
MPLNARHDTQGREVCQLCNPLGNCRRVLMKSNKKASVRGYQAKEPAGIAGRAYGQRQEDR